MNEYRTIKNLPIFNIQEVSSKNLLSNPHLTKSFELSLESI